MSQPNDTTMLIPLSRGMVAIVDGDDYERVSVFKWSVLVMKTKNKTYYYGFRTSNGKGIYLHRFILDASPGIMIDHINGDGLDCRRGNIRLATNSQNQANVTKSTPSSSRFKGVRPTKSGKWYAVIRLNGVSRTSKVVPSEDEAARIYDEMAMSLFGEYARTNFE